MNVVRTIERYVPRYSRFCEPSAELVNVYLVESGGRYFIKTPWAMVDAHDGKDTSDAQLSALLRPCFASLTEAYGWAKMCAPHWHDRRNDTVRDRLRDAIRWHGDFSGPIRLADAMGISEERLRGVVDGKFQATAREVKASRGWKGGAL